MKSSEMNFQKITKFDNWLLKIGNIYYSDHDKVVRAYEIILNNETD